MVLRKQRHLYAAAALLLLFVGQASAFAGGNGTASNPYEISNVDQLQNMSSNLTAHYELIQNINASETRNWNNGSGFDPVGVFKGSLDGNWHSVSDLYINRSNGNNIALFREIDLNATIQRVAVLNATIVGGEGAAVLVGGNCGKIVNETYVSGSVQAGLDAGGLVGATCSGSNVSRSFSKASVTLSNEDYINENAGGIVGENYGTLSHSYSVGKVSGGSSLGGLTSPAGKGPIIDSYWDINSSGQDSNYDGTGLTTDEMTGLDAKSNMAGFDFTDTWNACRGVNSGYPILASSRLSCFAGGSGTDTDPYEISNVDQLQNMVSDLDAHYVLRENIYASGTDSWNDGSGFTPVRPPTGSFDGNFHTIQNLTVERPNTDSVGLFSSGGKDTGNIGNLTLANVNVTGQKYVGAVSGQGGWAHYGSIRVSGFVSGSNYVGGFSGNFAGSASNISINATVKSDNGAGGLAGYIEQQVSPIIEDIHVSGEISAGNTSNCSFEYCVGSVAGYFAGTMQDVVATPEINVVDGPIAGLAGHSNDDCIDCYWDTNRTGTEIATVEGTFSASSSVNGYSTEEMTGLDAKSSLSGLDFSGTWSLVEEENQGYPFPEVFCGTGFDCSKPPSIESVDININETSSSRNLNFSLSSRWQQDIASYQGLSSVTAFTNSSLEASVSFPFSASISVTDFTGLSSQTRSVDLDRNDSGHRQDPACASLSKQCLNQTYTLSNQGSGPVSYSLGLDVPGTLDSKEKWTGTLNAGSSTTHIVESHGDWIEEKLHEFEPPEKVTLEKAFTASQALELTEQAGISWDNVSTSGIVDAPTQCSQNNATQISVPAGQTENKTIGFSCNTGSTGTPTDSLYDHGDYEKAWYNTTLTVASNLTENSSLVWQVNKSKLPSYSGMEPGSLEASINGKSEDVTVAEDGQFINVTVQDDFGNSSLHKGSHSAALTYEIADSDDNSTNISKTNHSITFSVSQYYTKTAASKSNLYFTAVNHKERPNTLYLETRDSQACSYFTIQSSYIGKNFGKKSNLRIAGRETGDNDTGEVILRAKVDLPNRSTIREKGLGDTFTCRFKTKAGIGTPEPLNLTVKLVDRKPQIVSAVEELVDTFLPELPDSALFKNKKVCLGPLEESQQFEKTGKGCETGNVVNLPIPTKEGAAIIMGGLGLGLFWIRYL